MIKNLFFIFIITLFLNNNVFGRCGGPYFYGNRTLSDADKKEIQKLEKLYDAIKIGKMTSKEILHLFGDYKFSFYDKKDYPNSDRLAYDIDLPVNFDSTVLPDPLNSLMGSSSKPVAGMMPGYSYQSAGSVADASRPSYRYSFDFMINKATQLVAEKHKSLNFLGFNGACLKPVIYLYPVKEQEVSVHLKYQGNITVSYPTYDPLIQGWHVRAYPNGKIINLSDNEEYSYLFWEGNQSKAVYDLSEGFIVEGDNAENFLRETLNKMGLTPREYNEFIVYWYPKLKQNKFNLVHFAHEEYEKIAPLEIAPKPDSFLRIFMVYKPLQEKVEIKPQEIKSFVRKGFTVVEWGGTEL